MRTKRCLAFLLAVLMLLSETTTAFAEGISANDVSAGEIPYVEEVETSEIDLGQFEVSGDDETPAVSLNEEATQEVVPEIPETEAVSSDEVLDLETIETETEQNILLDTEDAVHVIGIEYDDSYRTEETPLYVIGLGESFRANNFFPIKYYLSNGEVDYGYSGDSKWWSTFSNMTIRIFDASGNDVYDPKPGRYYINFCNDTKDISCNIPYDVIEPVTSVFLDEMWVLANHYEFELFERDGSTRGARYGLSLFEKELVEGELYELSSALWLSAGVYKKDEAGNFVHCKYLSGTKASFECEETGTYYFCFDTMEDQYVKIGIGDPVVKAEMLSSPYITEFAAGAGLFAYDFSKGAKIKVTYKNSGEKVYTVGSNSASETVRVSILEKDSDTDVTPIFGEHLPNGEYRV